MKTLILIPAAIAGLAFVAALFVVGAVVAFSELADG